MEKILEINWFTSKKWELDFPGGPVVKNPPADAGDTGLILGPGRSHVPYFEGKNLGLDLYNHLGESKAVVNTDKLQFYFSACEILFHVTY